MVAHVSHMGGKLRWYMSVTWEGGKLWWYMSVTWEVSYGGTCQSHGR